MWENKVYRGLDSIGKFLGVSETTLRNWMKEGKIKLLKEGGSYSLTTIEYQEHRKRLMAERAKGRSQSKA